MNAALLPPELRSQWAERGIFPLREGERWAAAALLARAFAADPLMRALLPPGENFEGRLRRFYDLTLRGLMRAGVCLAARDGERVRAFYAFLPPRRNVSLLDEVLGGQLGLVPLLGPRLLAGLEVQEAAARQRERLAPGAWYVALVATDPAAQGQGSCGPRWSRCWPTPRRRAAASIWKRRTP